MGCLGAVKLVRIITPSMQRNRTKGAIVGITVDDVSSDPIGCLLRKETRLDPYPYYQAMREHCPVRRVDPGFWLVTSYSGVDTVLSDAGLSVDANKAWRVTEPVPMDTVRTYKSSMLTFSDPPDHTRLRILVNRAFSQRAVRKLEMQLQQIIEHDFNRMADQNESDLVADFAEALPLKTIALIFGLHSDEASQLIGWSAALRESGDLFEMKQLQAILTGQRPGSAGDQGTAASDREHANREIGDFAAFCRDLIHQRSKRPADDMLSTMLAASETGDRLTESEMLAVMMNLLIGGHLGTTNTIGNAVVAMVEHPDQLRKLREDPALMPRAIEECFRFNGSSQVTRRIVVKEIAIDGIRIPDGEVILPFMAAANRDPAAFPEPDTFDIARDGQRKNFASGEGEHFCLGAALSRRLCGLTLAQVVKRNVVPLWGTEPMEVRPSLSARGFARIPVTVEH